MINAVMSLGYDEAKPFQPFKVLGDSIEFLLGIFAGELSRNLLDCPVTVGGAQKVTNSRKLILGFRRPWLLLDWLDDWFFWGGNAFEGSLGRRTACYGVGGLILRAQPANVAIAFFFGPLGVEGNEAFENDVVEGCFWPPSPLVGEGVGG
jgi:hypothetical protein